MLDFCEIRTWRGKNRFFDEKESEVVYLCFVVILLKSRRRYKVHELTQLDASESCWEKSRIHRYIMGTLWFGLKVIIN